MLIKNPNVFSNHKDFDIESPPLEMDGLEYLLVSGGCE
jgi:hypothetical protein